MRPTSDLEGCHTAHLRLFDLLDRCVAEGVDPAAPSALPDWTVGHVLTHLARNADGVRSMAEGAAVGEEWPMYASTESRNADIEAGAGRSLAELAADVRASAEALEAAWAALDGVASDGATDSAGWAGAGLTLRGAFPVAAMPAFRWREVEVHSVDLGLELFTTNDWSDAYVAWDTESRRSVLVARSDTIPDEVEAAAPRDRLAWMLGRSVDGLPEPPPF